MKSRSWVRVGALGAFLACYGAVFGQTFTVNSRTTPSGELLKLDQSLTVIYNVTATGLTQPVIPVLRPTNGSLANSISVTWNGTSATSSLTNLSFNIHLYNNTSLCGQAIDFELVFYSSQFSGSRTATPNSSSLMRFSSTAGGQITLTHKIIDTPTLPCPLSSVSPSTYFMSPTGVTQTVINDPNNRIYFLADYNLAGASWHSQFNFFLYALNGNQCTLNASIDLNSFPIVSAEITDQTVSPARTIVQAPVGGAGSCGLNDHGYNLFDVTNLDPVDSDCATTVRQSIDYHTGSGIYQLFWSYGGFAAVVRKFSIYVGQEGSCSALVNNFGAPPAASDFRVEDFYISSFGNVQASLTVPTGWGSNGTLNSNYRVTYYLRTDSGMTALGSETQSLDVTFNTAQTITTPANYFIEARIRKTDTNAVVSTTSSAYRHIINYAVQTVSFSKAEQAAIGGGVDHFLDPGETVSLPVLLTSSDGSNLPTLNALSGVVIDTNANNAVDGSDTVLVSNTPTVGGLNVRLLPVQFPAGTTSRTATLSYELLTSPTTPAVWFFSDITRTDSNGTTSTFRQYLSLRQLLSDVRDLNGQNTAEEYAYDFGSSSGTPDWTTTDTFPSGSNSGSWLYSSPSFGRVAWVGNGGTLAAYSSEILSLVSPWLPLGDSTSVDFSHLPQFSFNQSGGILEYRSRNNAGVTQWSNLVDDYGPSGVLNEFPFPENPPSYLSGKKVWMSNESQSESVTVNIPDSLGDLRNDVQFRFLFMDPSLADTGRSDGPTHWEVYDFTYNTIRLTTDNIFGVDEAQLTWDACDSPRIVLKQTAPISSANLTFEWYSSLDNLYNGISAGNTPGSTGLDVPFEPTVNGTYNYYVRIKYLGTERIIPVVVNKTEVCTNVCITREDAQFLITTESAIHWPDVKNITDCILVVNRICK